MSLFRKKENGERKLPVHIAIIMDGNGRWAKKRALPRTAGHVAGCENFKTIARYCNKIGVKYLTAYAFSTENWKRPQAEVEAIMNLLRDYLKDSVNFTDENIKVQFLGDRSALSEDIVKLMEKAEDDSKDATGLTLNLAVNYGGRDELLKAVQKIADSGLKGDEITEELIGKNLYTEDMPDPDLIIRPSGEYRLSNFLIWQSAYAEFWFSNVLWPDFKPKHLEEAIAAFNRRDRRMGGLGKK